MSLEAVGPYHVNVVSPGIPVFPHPLEHVKLSMQFPASPQSDARMTVVGQNPHRAFAVSYRQLKPGFAVRGFVGSPLK